MADYDWTGNPITTGQNTVGDTVTSSPSTTSSGFGDFFSNISSGNWGNALNTIGSVLSGGSGTGAQIAGVAGLSYLLNQLTGGSGTPYRGYTGGIPTYTATREQTPYSTQTMTTAEGKVVPRRPGSGGITYFKPTTYTKAADGGLMEGYPSDWKLVLHHMELKRTDKGYPQHLRQDLHLNHLHELQQYPHR